VVVDPGGVPHRLTESMSGIEEDKVIRIALNADREGTRQERVDANFSDFETGFSQLLGILRRPAPSLPPSLTSIAAYTNDFLEDMEDEAISLPSAPRIEILDTLRRLPRTGKKVRLEKYRHGTIPIRSVYDHVLSVAHTADHLISEIDHRVSPNDLQELARCIAFHELNEVILGDMPAYTNLSEDKRRGVRLYAHDRLRSVDPKYRERVANEFVGIFLSDKQRQSMRVVQERLEKGDSDPVVKFFRLLDKMDPIIAVWRYLDKFRGHLGDGGEFLRKLKDFFENRDVDTLAAGFTTDSRVSELVATLKNRSNATLYYQNRDKFMGQTFQSKQKAMFGLSMHCFCEIIEGRDVLYAEGDP
jgi:5'-deoxynucleotidase YfbR-like HD superfamily hydrolase